MADAYASSNLFMNVNETQPARISNVETLQWKRLLLAKAKLKASSRTSALLSGFAMVAMVEIELHTTISKGMLMAFSIITTLVVAVHLLALMISTCILPHIEVASDPQCGISIKDSPHIHMHWYIEIAWIFSTGIGILLFLAQMAVLAWVRFFEMDQAASIASTAIIVPVIIVFIGFAIHFYRQLISHKYEQSFRGLLELEVMARNIEGGQLQEKNNHGILNV